MVKALIELDDETNRMLNLIKAKHDLKDKSQAIAYLVKHGTNDSAQPQVVKYINDGDKWMLAEDIPDMDLFFLQIPLRCFVNEFEQPSGRAYKKMLSVQEGYHLMFYFGTKDCNDVGENIVEKIFNDDSFTHNVNKEIIHQADKLRAYCETIDENKLASLSNKELLDIFEMHGKIHTEYYQYCWIPVAADMFHNNLTNRLQKALKDKGYSDELVNEYFMILTQPTSKSLIQIEREEFLSLAITVSKDKSQRKIFEEIYRNFREQEVAKFGYKTHTKEYEENLERRASQLISLIKQDSIKLIKKHYQKYFYVSHMWVGKASTFEYYLKELMILIATHADVQATLKDVQTEFIESCKKRDKLLAKLKLEKKLVSIFDEFGEFMVTKIYRRYAQIYACYKMEFVQQEFAKRLGLTLIQARFLLPSERRDALLTGTVNKTELEERTKFCAYYAEKDKDVMYTGKEARDLSELAKRVEAKEITTFTGQIGCMGKARGIVRIIIRPHDMNKMKNGDILVSIATDPDIVPAMKKAAAIVTEQGGVTSHAAIVSRELRIPCVIGTKIATQVLKDGDLVEVDANKGIVTIIEKAKK